MRVPLLRTSQLVVLFLLLAATAPAQNSVSPSTASASEVGVKPSEEVTIPGSMRSFLRMAGISQKVTPPEVLPFLAHNVVALGYVGEGPNAKPTEFLKLLRHYLDQARQLSALAGPQEMIHVANCEQAKPLLAIIGYEQREACGPGTTIGTADPEKAFLAIDSGFPVADLEEAMRGGKALDYRYTSIKVPVIFSSTAWVSTELGTEADVIDALINDKSRSRLYWALSRMDPPTIEELREKAGLQKLMALAPMLDFYGSHICLRNGQVEVPGGQAAVATWTELAGTSPAKPTAFIFNLLNKDGGWLAAYFDTLARLNAKQQVYFADRARLKRFYEALRGPDINPNAVKGVFRPDPDLLILMTRLPLDANNQPQIPGNLDLWKEILRRKSKSKVAKEWAKRHLQGPDDLLAGLIALSRNEEDESSTEIFLALTELDRVRSADQQLTPATIRLMVKQYGLLTDQYRMFDEFEELDNASIARFINTSGAIDRISDTVLRADTLGIFQANIGLWQIFARQGQIPADRVNTSWQQAVEPFAGIRSTAQLFDAARTSLSQITQAAMESSHPSQDELIAALAGPNQTTQEGQEERRAIGNRIRSVMDDQRLISLDTLFGIGEGLQEMGKGAPSTDALEQLVSQLRETDMPKPIFSQGERSQWAAGLYNSRHITLERECDIAKLINAHAAPNELAGARGQLAFFLRDTLVGLNYAYYEPPGAQMLHNNPMLVRSHDFSGAAFAVSGQAWKTPVLIGKGSPASGGAHFSGSLADLPYAIARAEQNFVVPENVQALIWEEMVPSLLTSSVIPRWWNVSRNEMHAVALYQQSGEELIASAARDPQTRKEVTEILSDRFVPARLDEAQAELAAGNTQQVLDSVMPGDTFYLAWEFRQRHPDEVQAMGKDGQELDDLAKKDPTDASWDRISHDFGTPHPILTRSYSREFLEIQPFPSFTEYPSRLLAESWDSNNLYWARLADELNYSPVMLNTLIPELTRRMVEKIFASNFEDWPALLRAIDETGTEFRRGGVAALQTRTTRERN